LLLVSFLHFSGISYLPSLEECLHALWISSIPPEIQEEPSQKRLKSSTFSPEKLVRLWDNRLVEILAMEALNRQVDAFSLRFLSLCLRHVFHFCGQTDVSSKPEEVCIRIAGFFCFSSLPAFSFFSFLFFSFFNLFFFYPLFILNTYKEKILNKALPILQRDWIQGKQEGIWEEFLMVIKVTLGSRFQSVSHLGFINTFVRFCLGVTFLPQHFFLSTTKWRIKVKLIFPFFSFLCHQNKKIKEKLSSERLSEILLTQPVFRYLSSEPSYSVFGEPEEKPHEKPKYQLVIAILQILMAEDYKNFEEDHLRNLLCAYHGTNSKVDRALLSLFLTLESVEIFISEKFFFFLNSEEGIICIFTFLFSIFHFGPESHSFVNSQESALFYKPENPVEVFDCFSSEKMQITIELLTGRETLQPGCFDFSSPSPSFPLLPFISLAHSACVDESFLKEILEDAEFPQTSSRPVIYDPWFFLPLMKRILEEERISDFQKFVGNHCASFILISTSSTHPDVRAFAFQLLAKFYHLLPVLFSSCSLLIEQRSENYGN